MTCDNCGIEIEYNCEYYDEPCMCCGCSIYP